MVAIALRHTKVEEVTAVHHPEVEWVEEGTTEDFKQLQFSHELSLVSCHVYA